MIRDHDFNGSWWGERVGIVEDPAFFGQPDPAQRAGLAPYAWAEFRCALDKAPDPWRLAESGFAQVDTQLRFRIALNRLTGIPASSASLPVRFANAAPFVLRPEELPVFPHERFRHLPGATAEMVTRRYARWASALCERSPEWCVEVGKSDAPQGWFLAEPEEGHLHLALAMLHRDAAISGLDLYAAALSAFGDRGMRLGEAHFSIENRSVHNIYARLGAIFLEPTGCWLWTAR